eukprot:SAG31_NODE_11727_length_1002_cov_3.846069_2_plen_148_part_01
MAEKLCKTFCAPRPPVRRFAGRRRSVARWPLLPIPAALFTPDYTGHQHLAISISPAAKQLRRRRGEPLPLGGRGPPSASDHLCCPPPPHPPSRSHASLQSDGRECGGASAVAWCHARRGRRRLLCRQPAGLRCRRQHSTGSHKRAQVC